MIIYHVNEEKKTVVARFEGGLEYWKDSLFNLCGKILKNLPYIEREIIYKILDRQTNLIGKAKCHPDDKWDIDKGKLIAKRRLLDKWRWVQRCVLKELYASVSEEFERIEKEVFERLKDR